MEQYSMRAVIGRLKLGRDERTGLRERSALAPVSQATISSIPRCSLIIFPLISSLIISWLIISSLIMGGSLFAGAQTTAEAPASDRRPAPVVDPPVVDTPLPPVDLKSLPGNLFIDQKDLISTPFRMSQRDWQWTVPFALVSAISLASDTAIEKHVPTSSSTVSHAVTASNAGVAALAGVGAGMFLWGHAKNNDELRETGLLSGEAALDAVLDAEALNYIFGRERPFSGDGKGQFFRGKDSFPSEHAAVSFAIASVIAHEYPGVLTQILAYGMAGGVGAARFAGQKHFATDILAGSALGWYLGRQVYRDHSHYSAADIAKLGTFSKGEDENASEPSRNAGSPSVPLDSWVYPAMERLIALGYVHSQDLGMRPWTRMECARLVAEEAGPQIQNSEFADEDAQKIYQALAGEFEDETARLGGDANLGANLDAIYTRFTGISGTPLRDGLHFGQTITNDYGRPYAEGFNNVTGFSSHAVAGSLFFYARAEYQHAPPGTALSTTTAIAIQNLDGEPATPPITAPAAVNQVDLVEGYAGIQLNNWQFTFGKQALWWGEDETGAMLFSTNAAPILMLQINRVKPFKLPVLGDIRVSYLVGRLSGYHWVFGQDTGWIGSWTQSLSDQPFIVGEKLTLKPSANLELGFTVTSLFGGPGVPATLHKLLKAGFSSGNGAPGTSGDPGDRRGGFDMAYRIPGLRDGLTFYADAFTDDEPSPWVAWNKAAVTSGFYLARMPGIPKLDLRAEAVYTDVPTGGKTVRDGFFYINDRFKSGYTNDGSLIGSWIGRDGQGVQAWATYWLNPKSKVQFNFRHQKVSSQFIPEGGTLTDFGFSSEYRLRSNLGLSARVQHERWLFPVIQPNASKNVTAAVQIVYEPGRLFRRSNPAAGQP
jgi:membrane-associated phospholipid phosphatase